MASRRYPRATHSESLRSKIVSTAQAAPLPRLPGWILPSASGRRR